jgi:hypothetical protein
MLLFLLSALFSIYKLAVEEGSIINAIRQFISDPFDSLVDAFAASGVTDPDTPGGALTSGAPPGQDSGNQTPDYDAMGDSGY